MTAMLRPAFATVATVAVLLAGCVVAPYPCDSHPTTVSTPPSFDRSWDAALGAAAVLIDLRQQADNSLRVSFDATDSKESNPALNERWLAAYNRRMGR